MSTRIEHDPGGYAVIICDSCGDRDQRYIEGVVTTFALEIRTFWRDMTRVGWTFWSSRSLRTYCPACKPKPGHKMRDLTHNYRREG